VAYIKRDVSAVEEAYKALRDLPERKISAERLETLRLDLRLDLGVHSAEADLLELEKQKHAWTEPSMTLARYYQKLGAFVQAKSHCEIALARATSDDAKADCLVLLGNIVAAESKSVQAIELLRSHAAQLHDLSAKATVLDALSDHYEKSGNKRMMHICLERSLLMIPGAGSRRFKLAYSYSEDDETLLLALWHYRVLETQDFQNGTALNNLGVVYEKLKLPGKRVSTWKVAQKTDKPYPSANLANELINAGFWDDAERYLSEIPESERKNIRVADVANRLQTARDSEDRKVEQLESAMRLQHRYMAMAADRAENPEVLKISVDMLAGDWRGDGSESMNLTATAGDKRITGSFVIPSRGILGDQQEYELRLTRTGAYISGRAISKSAKGSASTILSGGNPDSSVFLVLDAANRLTGLYWSSPTSSHEIALTKQ
jgi:tetratricopeptide (TPR) repeat protein